MGCGLSTSKQKSKQIIVSQSKANSEHKIVEKEKPERIGSKEKASTQIVEPSLNEMHTKRNQMPHESATAVCDDLELARQEKAAILIQRVARGVEARGSVLKRRSSEIARDTFEKSLDLHLSPAENASKALLALAAVSNLRMDTDIQVLIKAFAEAATIRL